MNLKKYIKSYYSVFALFSVIFFSGCVHNNGDIGVIGGLWQITNITNYDSIIYDKGNLFLAFQGQVGSIKIVTSPNIYDEGFGVFHHTGDTLSLEIIEGNKDLYKSFFFDTNPIQFEIKKLTKKHMILSHEKKEWLLQKYD